MDPILYSKRGGYRISGPAALGSQSNGGTWPLGKLTLREQSLTFKFLRNQYNLQYTDIDHIEITRSGWVRFITKDQTKSFAFAGAGAKQIIHILQEKQVSISNEELAKLDTARISNTGQIIFVMIFLVLLLLFFLGFHHAGPFSHLKFRGQ